jgi:hypothetical protein
MGTLHVSDISIIFDTSHPLNIISDLIKVENKPVWYEEKDDIINRKDIPNISDSHRIKYNFQLI